MTAYLFHRRGQIRRERPAVDVQETPAGHLRGQAGPETGDDTRGYQLLDALVHTVDGQRQTVGEVS